MPASSAQAPVLRTKGRGPSDIDFSLTKRIHSSVACLFLVPECQDIGIIDRRFVAVEGYIA